MPVENQAVAQRTDRCPLTDRPCSSLTTTRRPRRCCARLLEGPFDVIDCVTDGEALVRAAERLSPDVIVSDIGMPHMDGIEAVRRILATNRDARVVFVTVQSDVCLVERSLAEGALGYVVKQVAGEELVPAVHAALRGQRHVSAIVGFRDDGADCRDGAHGGSARRDGG